MIQGAHMGVLSRFTFEVCLFCLLIRATVNVRAISNAIPCVVSTKV